MVVSTSGSTDTPALFGGLIPREPKYLSMTKLKILIAVTVFSCIAWSEWAPIVEFESKANPVEPLPLVN